MADGEWGSPIAMGWGDSPIRMGMTFQPLVRVPQVHSARDTKNYVVDPEDKSCSYCRNMEERKKGIFLLYLRRIQSSFSAPDKRDCKKYI